MITTYIYDPQSKEEIVANYYRSLENNTDNIDEPIIVTSNIVKLRTEKIGVILSEIISLNSTKLRDDIPATSWGDIFTILNIPNIVIISNNIKEWIYLLNCIDSIREYIDLCNLGKIGFNTGSLKALFYLLGAFGYMNEEVQLIQLKELEEHSKWDSMIDSPNSSHVIRKTDYDTSLLNLNISSLIDHLSIDSGLFENNNNSHEQFYLYARMFHSIATLLFYSLENCVAESISIKKCKNCDKYFAPEKRSDAVYCDRSSPQDPNKTCKEYGARQAWQTKLKEDEAAGLYRKIYMSKQMLVKRNPDIKEYQEAFEWFKLESKLWKKAVKEGAESEDDYIQWLKKAKERKTLNNG